MPCGEPTPGAQGRPRYNRGRERGRERESRSQADSSSTPAMPTRGQRSKIHPHMTEWQISEGEGCQQESLSKGVSPPGRGRVHGKYNGRRKHGKGRGHFYRGRSSKGPRPPLAMARLLASKPRARTVLMPRRRQMSHLGGRRCFRGMGPHLRSHLSHHPRRWFRSLQGREWPRHHLRRRREP